ncbi:hypothetical protein [Mesobacillus jeotgali]|uniref:hypothetical protein n=1 Tax=Mesobacillus jeotgali TaxID=129985 RepID=UPI0009A72B20|nr:hypothetical protein [Mesobacillus jeotgali]
MTVAELTSTINKIVDDLDFATARVLLEENMDVLNEHRNRLNSNARELLNFISEMHKTGAQPLTRKEMSLINAVNSYASKFDVRGLKLLIKDHPKLFLRSDLASYINADAKIVLESLGAIQKNN